MASHPDSANVVALVVGVSRVQIPIAPADWVVVRRMAAVLADVGHGLHLVATRGIMSECCPSFRTARRMAIHMVTVLLQWLRQKPKRTPGVCHLCGCAVADDLRECDDCWFERNAW